MPEPTATAAPAIGMRDLLRLADFRRLYLAQAISDIGDGMTYLALFLLVLDLTGSTAAIALMSILVALPPVTIGLFAGAYADRHDRRRIMLVSDTLRAVVVLAMLLVAREAAIPALFALACLQAVIGTFFAPARMAMLPRVVPAAAAGLAMLGAAGSLLGKDAGAGDLQMVLRGLPHNITTKMDLALWDLAGRIREDRDAAVLLRDGSTDDLAGPHLRRGARADRHRPPVSDRLSGLIQALQLSVRG